MCPYCCGGLPRRTFCPNCGSLTIYSEEDRVWSHSEEGKKVQKKNSDKITKRIKDAMEEIENSRSDFEGENI